VDIEIGKTGGYVKKIGNNTTKQTHKGKKLPRTTGGPKAESKIIEIGKWRTESMKRTPCMWNGKESLHTTKKTRTVKK